MNKEDKLNAHIKAVYVPEFEGLRGLMALWVVCGHVMNKLGIFYSPAISAVQKGLVLTNIPVDIFIALSGFAIICLISKEWHSYGAYMAGRFFRIYPVYFIVFLIALAMYPWRLEQVMLDPAMNPTLAEVAAGSLQSFIQHGFKYITSHLLLLHGMVPDVLLPGAAGAILGPAWSLSLEWQFYLIAPLLIFIINRSVLGWTAVVLLFLILSVVLAHYHIQFTYNAFIINKIWLFFLGFSLFYFLQGDIRIGILLLLSSLPGILFSTTVMATTISYCLWALLSGLVLLKQQCAQRYPVRLFSRVLNSWLIQWLGKLSFSIYLLHVLMLDLAFNVYLSLAFKADFSWYGFAALLLLTLMLTIPCCYLLCNYIEMPLNKYGKRFRHMNLAMVKA